MDTVTSPPQPQQQPPLPYKYYEPPPPRPLQSSDRATRTFADRATEHANHHILNSNDGDDDAHSANGVQHSNSRKHQQPEAQEQELQNALSIDPYAVPSNLRTKPWSPDILSPRTRTREDEIPHAQAQAQAQAQQEQPLKESRQQANVVVDGGGGLGRINGGGTGDSASESIRRGLVPHRSPLQKLEATLASKGEKRAKVEEAEARVQAARRRSEGPVGGQGGPIGRQDPLRGSAGVVSGRIVSEGTTRSGRYDADGRSREEDKARRVSAEDAELGAQKFRLASENLRKEMSPPVNGRASMDVPPPHRQNLRDERPRVSDTRQYASVQQVRIHRPIVKEPNFPTTNEQRQSDYRGAPMTRDQAKLPSRTASSREPDPSSAGPAEAEADPYGPNHLGRTESQKYQHRARDAGFVGAAAAMAATATAAERGKAAHERRKSAILSAPDAESSPLSPTAVDGLGGTASNKLQKRAPGVGEEVGRDKARVKEQRRGVEEPEESRSGTRRLLSVERMNGGNEREGSQQQAPRAGRERPVRFGDPPGMKQQQTDFAAAELGPANAPGKHRHFGGILHHHREHQSYQRDRKPLEEWRNAKPARLRLEDLEFETLSATSTKAGGSADKDAAWWEQQQQTDRRTSSSSTRQPALSTAQYDGPYEEEATRFKPPLYLKCGPLLRYTGLHTSSSSSREVWRGTIMIVTEDAQSDYSSVPTLRIFAQDMTLQPAPSRAMLESGHELPPEYEDPVAGQVKLSRTGRPLYVRPVHDLEGGVDLSREENPQGLYAATRTPVLGPQSLTSADGKESRHITFQDKSRVKRASGEKAGVAREVKAVRLHRERRFTFWRFGVEIELGSRQHRVAYRINKGPALGFWVPARGETMNLMFHSCNGFSTAVDPNTFSGPDPLWRDVMNAHQRRPFHVMLGGGDQIYNDAAMRDCTLLAKWLAIKNPLHKHSADFTPAMQDELEAFYLNRYAMWFSQGLFAMANSQIPMINMWDDHDIIDGFGSYPHAFMSAPVFSGLGMVAFKYYMLFQHQSVIAETAAEEPSWLLGAGPGPYIAERSRSVFMRLGRKVGFLGLDCRTERMRDEILSQASYDLVFQRLTHELQHTQGGIKHLIVLLGVPIAYPRLNFLENILTSRVMDPIKALARTGALGGFVNKFDGGVEILDDLDDHWTAKGHKHERNVFVQELQDFAAEHSVRITILGGDVHLGAVGQFYSARHLAIPKHQDHRYMPNVISSAIVNTPPPNLMADVLNRRNKVHHLDAETDEDLIPMFEQDVDGRPRANKCLLPRRNYCTIREYAPGASPPPTPMAAGEQELQPGAPQTANGFPVAEEEARGGARFFPPGSMRRTMSLTRMPGNLVRRLSGSGSGKNPPMALATGQGRPYSEAAPPGILRSNSLSGPRPDEQQVSYFPPTTTGERPVNQLFRRPTTVSIKEARKAAAKGGAEIDADGHDAGHVNVEGALDISLNMEIDQHDPSGATVPYRLLVPALWYEAGEQEEEEMPHTAAAPQLQGRRVSLVDRVRGRFGRRHEIGEDGYSRSASPNSDRDDDGNDARHSFDSAKAQLAQAGGAATRPPQQHLGQERDGPGADGAGAQRRHVSGPPDHSSNAYTKGYNLASPPIGSKQPAAAVPTTSADRNIINNNPYPQSGYRRASAPTAPTRQPANEPWRHQNDYEDSEGSLTPENEFAPNSAAKRPGTQERRLSKAERFFGIGDDTGPWGGSGGMKRGEGPRDDGGPAAAAGPARKKPNWMVWK